MALRRQLHDVELLLTWDRADLGVWLSGSPTGMTGALDDPLDEFVGDRAMNDQAASVAALAHVEVPPKTTASSAASRSASAKELGILPTEFEFHLFQVALGRGDDAVADAGRTGEADHVDVGVIREAVADDAARPVTMLTTPAGKPASRVAGRAGPWWRGSGLGFDDRSVADGEGERQFLADDQQREVPGRDHAHDAHRFVRTSPAAMVRGRCRRHPRCGEPAWQRTPTAQRTT